MELSPPLKTALTAASRSFCSVGLSLHFLLVVGTRLERNRLEALQTPAARQCGLRLAMIALALHGTVAAAQDRPYRGISLFLFGGFVASLFVGRRHTA